MKEKKTNKISFREKIKNLITYAHIRQSIGIKNRILFLLLVYSSVTIITTTLPLTITNGIVSLIFVGATVYTYALYGKTVKSYKQYKAYRLYEVNNLTGTIHMQYVDLCRLFKHADEKKVKDELIRITEDDMLHILDDYISSDKKNLSGMRRIQTHRTFARVFLQCLRSRDIIHYQDEEMEGLLKYMQENNVSSIDGHTFATSGKYLVTIRYMGYYQNKMLALRKRFPGHGIFKKFCTPVPYYDISVTELDAEIQSDISHAQ